MTQRTVDPVFVFIEENSSKQSKLNFITNKIVVYHIDDTWSEHFLILNIYGPE